MRKIFNRWGYCTNTVPLKCLYVFFILLSSFTATAQEEGKKVSFKVESASLQEVLTLLSRNNVRLVYDTSIVVDCDKMITLNVTRATVAYVLNNVLEGTGFSYKESETGILIKKIQRNELLEISGTVSDVNGEPLIGVTVVEKGTYIGLTTDVNGCFRIRVPRCSSLQFSYIGMETKELYVDESCSVQIRMEEQSNEMEEVVITGFQVLKKRESTSSIVSLKAEDIIEPVGTSIDQMLQGKVPGMAVLQQTSTVMAAPKIRIRGSSSIMGSREPVWVLDGVVLKDPVKLDATELNSMDRVNLIGNAISGLNPEDIDRIDILKDASATALYGTKAANGVIVITTKRGKEGVPSIRYSSSMSFVQRPTYDKMFLMNSNDRIDVSEEMHRRGLQFAGYTPRDVGYEGALQDLWDNRITRSEFNSRVQDLRGLNTDWFGHLFRNAFSHSHTLSASGGSSKASYYFSAGYSDQTGATLNEDGQRYSFMSNLSFRISERFNVNASLNGSVNKTNRPTVDLFQYAYNTSRAIAPFNPDGSYLFYDQSKPNDGLPTTLVYNVFNELAHTGSFNETRSLGVNLNMDYKLASWISVNAIVGYNSSATNSETYADEQSYKVAELRKYPFNFDLSTLTPKQLEDLKNKFCELPYGGMLTSKTANSDALSIRASVNMNKVFRENHSISLNAGMSIESVQYKGYSKTNYGYLPDRGKNFVTIENIQDWPIAVKRMMELQPTVADNVTHEMAYYASVAYGYKSKYIFSANARGDASNKLGSDKSARFLPVWSFSGRWNINDELFMEPLDNVLSTLAVRASFGIQGNVTDDHNPNMLISLGSLDSKSEEYYANLISLPNHGLLWEKTASWNAGLDFGFFKGRLTGCAEYYYKKGRDQLLRVEVTSTNGAKLVTINGGDIENKGWELSLSGTPIQSKDFSWTLTFNTSKNYNKVTNAGDNPYTYNDWLNGTIVKNGYAVNSFYSYRFGGLDKNGYPTFLGIEERDANGNLLIATQEEAYASALTHSGNREPILTGGLTSYFKWKNFSLNCIFSMALGAKLRLNDLYYGDNFKLPYPHQNMSSDFVNRWRKPGDELHTNIPVLTDEYLSISTQTGASGPVTTIASNYWQMYNNSDIRVVSGSFLRCRSISMSYSIPDKLLKNKVKSASFGFSVSNPFVINSKELMGRDPEQVTMGSGTIPPQQNYSLTLNVTF